jgi:nicotinate-nucleotide adenylyltransferase
MNLNVFKNTNFFIGLLGGSFNPPHFGHLFITNQLINKLNLDYVWWILTPKNPLKESKDLMRFEERMLACQKITAQNPKIIVTDLEYKLNNSITYETLNYIFKNYGGNNFVFIIGADNLANFHLWHHWQDIWQKIKIVVYGRKNYQHKSLKSEAAIKFGKYRVTSYNDFKEKKPPCWIMTHGELINISSTQLRKKALNDKEKETRR